LIASAHAFEPMLLMIHKVSVARITACDNVLVMARQSASISHDRALVRARQLLQTRC
jgi:hypothetical protein